MRISSPTFTSGCRDDAGQQGGRKDEERQHRQVQDGAAQGHPQERAGPGRSTILNITAMLDMMTIILVFLLKSMSSSSASIPQSNDMTLPTSIITSEPAQEGTSIVISKTQILVGDDPHPGGAAPEPRSLAQSGIDAKYKRNGPNDLYIVPLANALQAARADRQADSPGQGARRELFGSDRHRRHHHALSLAHRGALHARSERVRQVPLDGPVRRQEVETTGSAARAGARGRLASSGRRDDERS